MNSLISPDDHWVIWTFLVGMAALSIYLEQKFLFVKKITGAAVAICAGMLVSNIGLPSSISKVLLEAPLMILFCAIILAINFLVTIILGKWFKFELEELVLAAIITSGGPMNGVAVAISKNWHNLIFPSLMLGVWGYVIGNYIGYLMGILLQAIL